MWAYILLFAILLPILALAAVIAFASGAIVMLRRRQTHERIRFISVVHAYAALMILVGLFMVASGIGVALKVALAETVSHEFAYDRFNRNAFGISDPEDIEDDDVEDDAIAAFVLALVGAGMFIPHALGVMALARKGARSSPAVTRGYNLVGLSTATIGLLAAGGTAIGSVLQRVADDSIGWRDHHPAEPLAFAIVLAFVTAWFAYQLWNDVAGEISTDNATLSTQAV